MIKRAYITLALLSSVVAREADQCSGMERDSIMAVEAESFLKSMPEGLQLRQENAVRSAIAGDVAPLAAVRASRNAESIVVEGVEAIDIEERYRIYRPADAVDEKLPLLIYLHGGGWCFGSINSCSRFCMELAREARIAVMAVEYPLAPENPYPVALDCCVEAVEFSRDRTSEYGFDTDNISIGGDSSGGNLALATALRLLSAHKKLLKSVVTFYPVTKAWNDGSQSWQMYGSGYGLDGGIMEAFNEAYLGGRDADSPFISPSNATVGQLAEFPPVLMINAEKDILRDQGKAMCDLLTQAGTEVVHRVLPGTTHLFITVAGQEAAFAESVRMTAEFLSGMARR